MTDEVHERTELLTAAPAEALTGLLGVAPPDEEEGLPPAWHWVYLLDRPAQDDLGPDGHPVRGAVPEPPGPGLRRMWAGGRVETLAPLRLGREATRRTRVVASTEKRGRSGPMTLVQVGHEVHQGGQVVVRERQDLVYREAAGPPPVPVEPGEEQPVGPGEWAVEVSPTLLFRFSALTYNGHRIHYDRDYATGVEGYPGLVTHGPLQALAMAEGVRRAGPAAGFRPATLDYRLVSPLFDHQGLVVGVRPSARGADVVVRDRWGRRTATGSLTRA